LLPRAAIANSRQLAFGLFDQAIHTGVSSDSRAAYAAAMTSVSRVVPQEGTSPAARFGHMVGYDARVRVRFGAVLEVGAF
jgi:Zn-dependent oligopeptidase